MSTVTVSSKGQIVLPAALRRRLQMGAGSTIEVTQDGDSLRCGSCGGWKRWL